MMMCVHAAAVVVAEYIEYKRESELYPLLKIYRQVKHIMDKIGARNSLFFWQADPTRMAFEIFT
jgi:hypothetical protein